jgi:hypothetical protein
MSVLISSEVQVVLEMKSFMTTMLSLVILVYCLINIVKIRIFILKCHEQYIFCGGFEVHTAGIMKNVVIRDVSPCGAGEVH